jgi:hypothetical protein
VRSADRAAPPPVERVVLNALQSERRNVSGLGTSRSTEADQVIQCAIGSGWIGKKLFRAQRSAIACPPPPHRSFPPARLQQVNFAAVISTLCTRLDAAQVRYALIGGFAMALRGVQRATMDLDFILMLEDLEIAHGILVDAGYRREFHSENVSHYLHPDAAWGRIDILHAFRGPSLGMLQRAERLAAGSQLALPVVITEDLIGLKVQALANDPTRAVADWHDIGLLIAAAREQRAPLDWELVEDYLQLFHFEAKLPELKTIHGATQ